MAFDDTNFDANASGSKGALGIHAYTTSDDNLATALGSGYFDDIQSILSTGDIIFVKASDGTKIVQVTNTSGVITVTAANDGTNDIVFS